MRLDAQIMATKFPSNLGRLCRKCGFMFVQPDYVFNCWDNTNMDKMDNSFDNYSKGTHYGT